ncbi:MAG: FAD:protein FMN transferase [Chloroflexi bacterium]|nr:FAD:protein FMN transferase [Chloroflexota bacterium]OJV90056.1 MAG: hypothetical protein BGO39_01365 [Chloroflexi bacterium 54-19]
MTTIEKTYHAFVFRAMNTDIEILIYPSQATNPTSFEQKASAVAEKVRQLFEEVEASLSRFRPESELCQLNRQGYLEGASPLLYNSISQALELARRTYGIFDPTILDALERAGYNRSFELLDQSALTSFAKLSLPTLNGYHYLTLEPVGRVIRLPIATRIDLGGIGKGMTVDLAVALMREAGFQNFMVSAGGDIYLGGIDPENRRGWKVRVQNPLKLADSDILTSLQVRNRGVATSAVTKRSWLKDGKIQNHLIDPRTGSPVDNGLASVTVVAPSTVLADVLAKTALILGPVDGPDFIKRQLGCTALFVGFNGSLTRTAGLPEELGRRKNNQ